MAEASPVDFGNENKRIAASDEQARHEGSPENTENKRYQIINEAENSAK